MFIKSLIASIALLLCSPAKAERSVTEGKQSTGASIFVSSLTTNVSLGSGTTYQGNIPNVNLFVASNTVFGASGCIIYSTGSIYCPTYVGVTGGGGTDFGPSTGSLQNQVNTLSISTQTLAKMFITDSSSWTNTSTGGILIKSTVTALSATIQQGVTAASFTATNQGGLQYLLGSSGNYGLGWNGSSNVNLLVNAAQYQFQNTEFGLPQNAYINLFGANGWIVNQSSANVNAVFTNSITDKSIASGTQCIQANSSGQFSGTGTPCMSTVYASSGTNADLSNLLGGGSGLTISTVTEINGVMTDAKYSIFQASVNITSAGAGSQDSLTVYGNYGTPSLSASNGVAFIGSLSVDSGIEIGADEFGSIAWIQAKQPNNSGFPQNLLINQLGGGVGIGNILPGNTYVLSVGGGISVATATVTSTMTVQGNAFSVGTSSFVVNGGLVYLGTATGTQIYRCSGGTAANMIMYGSSGAEQSLCTGGGGTNVATGVFLP